MHHFQVGRVVEPWINFTPPIRGGVFRLHPEQEDLASSDDDLSVASTLNEYSTAQEDSKELPPGSCRRRKDEAPSHRSPADRAVVDAYVAKLIEGEIHDSLRDYPSLDADTQHSIDLEFQALHQRVKDQGFYHCNLTEYLKEISRYAILFTSFCVALHAGWYLLSAALLGLFWVSDRRLRSPTNADLYQHQIMFTAHDAGHRGITHSMFTDTLIGMFIADFCCGLSIGWWKSSHNVHHLITNHPVSGLSRSDCD